MITALHKKSRISAASHGRSDSNARHSVLETDALPTELHPYNVEYKNNQFAGKPVRGYHRLTCHNNKERFGISSHQRRERDSNPRNLSVQRFSRPPQSTTLPSLLIFRTMSKTLELFTLRAARKTGLLLPCKARQK